MRLISLLMKILELALTHGPVIGTDTWASVDELEEVEDTAPFFTAVRNFYKASTEKMLVKFPFGDSLSSVRRLSIR